MHPRGLGHGFVCSMTIWSLMLSAASISFATNTITRPNIVLIMADDQGWGETGFHGHPHLKTPVLDEMASRGIRMDRFYSAHVNCSPTRTSILTGRHPIRSGVFGPNWSTRPEEITIAHILQKAGYRTGHFGKWHVGAVKSASPTNPARMGFDEFLSHDNFFELNPVFSRNGAPPERYEGESSEIVVREACRFIQSCAKMQQPFLTLVWFGSPHSPYSALERDLASYAHIENKQLQNRLAEISAMDRAVGTLRKTLQELRVDGDTLVWYCSDNGIGHDPRMSFNGPWREKKGSIYEGGVRVPAIIEWPNGIKKPRTTEFPCVTTDILPTILDLLESNQSLPNRPLDGVSLRKMIVDGDDSPRPKPIGFWKYASDGESKNDRWMPRELTMGTTPTVSNPSIDFLNFRHPVARSELLGDAAWNDNRFKLVVRGKGTRRQAELYDLIEDPSESRDLASENPERVARMTTELIQWQKSVENSLTGADY